MNKKTAFFILVIGMSISSCVSTFKTLNISDNVEPENGLIYSLPSTELNVIVEITEIHKQKGPFYEFLQVYFDTESGIKEDELIYRITDVSIVSNPIIDKDHIYAVIPGKKTSVNLLNITPEGFPAGINLTDYQAEKIQTDQKNLSEKISEGTILNYADFSLNSIMETKYDTLYKEVMIDSVIVRVPIITKKDVIKSKEKRAKEIADILFLLRDDRNALLKGENDGNNFPDGEALKIMISELNNLEKQYMSLFSGRVTKVPKTYSFKIVPNKNTMNYPIFYFSEETGVSDSINGQSVYLRIAVENASPSLNQYIDNSLMTEFQKSKIYKGFVYRIPGKTDCEIYLQNELLYQKSLLISQEGELNMIPAKLLNETISVEFYPETGSLKRISKIKE